MGVLQCPHSKESMFMCLNSFLCLFLFLSISHPLFSLFVHTLFSHLSFSDLSHTSLFLSLTPAHSSLSVTHLFHLSFTSLFALFLTHWTVSSFLLNFSNLSNPSLSFYRCPSHWSCLWWLFKDPLPPPPLPPPPCPSCFTWRSPASAAPCWAPSTSSACWASIVMSPSWLKASPLRPTGLY